jgi:hypothetical protein
MEEDPSCVWKMNRNHESVALHAGLGLGFVSGLMKSFGPADLKAACDAVVEA